MRRLDLQRFADTEAVQRYQEALYINVGAAGAAATYELFGTGVTKADESFDTKTKESPPLYCRLKKTASDSLLFSVFHQSGSALPGLTHLLADPVVAVLELIEYEGVDLCRIYFAVFVQHLLVCQDVYDLAKHPEAVLAFLQLGHLALQGDGEFLHHRGVYPCALYSVKTAALKFIGHLVAGGDAEEIGGLQMVHIGDAQGKSTPLFNIFYM